MLSLNAAVISLALFTVVLSSYAYAGKEMAITKKATLQAMNKEFSQKSLGVTVQQALKTPGENCIEKKKIATELLQGLASYLEDKGILMEIGFRQNGECNCFDPRLVAGLGNELLACIENGLTIISHSEHGNGAIVFASIDGVYSFAVEG